ncbi:MAG: hypothetical protein WAN35_19265, partial [Terracidiphilus sp.]
GRLWCKVTVNAPWKGKSPLMPLIDKIREEKLIELARKHFAPVLKKAELRVLRDSASSEELPEPDENAPRPVVRAEFLRWLASDPEAATLIDPHGLRVYGATIPGKLDLFHCHVKPALDFRRCEFQGEINLLSAETQGIFIFDSSLAEGIRADRVIIHGPLFLLRIQSKGEISLPGAEIKGELDCSGAKLKATGNALFADGAKIGDNVFLDDSFESEGTINLLGAEITGQLTCRGAKLKATGDALSADGAKIGGGVFLIHNFKSEGEIHMSGAEIGGNLVIRVAKVAEVDCHNTVIKGDLIWQKIEKSEAKELYLAGAKVKNLRDDKESWPDQGMLNLDGLVYEELTLHEPLSEEDIKAKKHAPELPLVAKERIAWIMLQKRDCCTEPQPWMQLRELLEKKGDRKGAKYVLRRFRWLQAKEKSLEARRWIYRKLRIHRQFAKSIFWVKRIIRRIKKYIGKSRLWCRIIWLWNRAAFLWSEKSPISIPLTTWHKAFAMLEENPLRIGWSILVTLTLGTLVFAGAIRSGAMIETIRTQPNMISTYEESTKGKPRNPDESNKPVSLHYTSFQPFIYTLENAVPLVKLGMDERWMPDLQHQPRAWFPQIGWMDGLKWFNSYGFLVWFRWALIVWGWIQATVLAAAVADRFKK